MPADVSTLINLTLEGVSDVINENLITSDTLISQFRNGRAQRVSNRLYRIVQQIALAGGDSRSVPPDGGALPLGSFSQYIAGGVTPVSLSTAMNWTELMAMVGVKVDGVAIQNAITKGLGDLTTMMKNWEDIGMHTDGTGTLATLSAAPPNANTVNLSATPFGARNIEIGQTVDIVNPTGNVTRGSLTVLNKGALLGAVFQLRTTGQHLRRSDRGHRPLRRPDRRRSQVAERIALPDQLLQRRRVARRSPHHTPSRQQRLRHGRLGHHALSHPVAAQPAPRAHQGVRSGHGLLVHARFPGQ
jgi:hypothetical protein